VSAPLALWLVVRPTRGSQPLVGAWNTFGALDLVLAIALDFTSAPNSPAPLFDVSPGIERGADAALVVHPRPCWCRPI
jgi:hypothetical protein